MDSTRDTVRQPDVEFGQGVFRVDRRLGQITNRSGLDHVLDGVSLDGFVLFERNGISDRLPGFGLQLNGYGTIRR